VTRQIVQQLRESEINMDTLADTPIFSCVRVPAAEMLERLV
jgi:chlorite dismutase